MDIRVLSYFVAVVQTKNISGTADALHVTQPTLSRQVKELEDELDTILFHRGSRKIQLADDGQYFYNRTIEVLALVGKTENNIRKSDDIAGDIYIGTTESQSLDIVTRAIKTLTEQYPDARVHIRSGSADDILEHLNKGVCDLRITIDNYDIKKCNHLTLGNRDRWGALVPKGRPLTLIEKPNLADALTYPLITSAQTSTEPSVLTGLEDYRVVTTYNLLYNASLLVKVGVGIALCLGSIVDTSYPDSDLTFVPFTESNHGTLQILWKKRNTLPPNIRQFLKIMRGEIGK